MAKDDTKTDDDLDTDLDIGEDGEDQDDTEEDDKGTAPVKADGTPYTQADIDALQETLRKSRRDVRAAKRGTSRTSGDDKTDPEQTKADAESAAEAKWKPTVVRTAARAAFAEAGLVVPKGKAESTIKRVLRMLDMDDIEINEDGDVEGLDEQIEEIKADCPELFRVEERRRTTRLDASNRGGGGGRKQSSSDLIAAQLLGSSR